MVSIRILFAYDAVLALEIKRTLFAYDAALGHPALRGISASMHKKTRQEAGTIRERPI